MEEIIFPNIINMKERVRKKIISFAAYSTARIVWSSRNTEEKEKRIGDFRSPFFFVF